MIYQYIKQYSHMQRGISIAADLINVTALFFIGALYYTIGNSFFLVPLSLMLMNFLLLLHACMNRSVIIYGIYLMLSAFFYMIFSTYVLHTMLMINSYATDTALILFLQMNIPSVVFIIAIIANTYFIEKSS